MSEKRYYVNSALYLCDNDLSNTLSIFECADLLNQLTKENEQLKEEIRAYPINEQYAEEIIQQNQKLRIERNDLRRENKQLREELSECEKFRYSVFKRIEKTIEDNCVLNKDAKYPCKAYDECLKRQGTNKPLPCIVNWMMGRPFENMLQKEGR